MTVRQNIISNILGRLATISTSTGYSRNYNYTGEWLLNVSEAELEDYTPAIVLIDDSQDVVAHDRVKTDFLLHLTFAVWSSGEDSQEDLRNSIADIYECLGKDPSCGGYVDEITPLSDQINLIQKDDVYGSGEVKIDVSYSCRAWTLEELQ